MARIIPNERSWIAYTATVANLSAPTSSEISSAVDLTDFVVSLTASSQGNTVPTPSLGSLFETSVPGTSAATFTADFYRDDEDDLAWETLPRGVQGFFIISRFGGSGAQGKPSSGDNVEVWPVYIVSRTAGPLTSNTAQTFTCTASVPEVPAEDATVAT